MFAQFTTALTNFLYFINHLLTPLTTVLLLLLLFGILISLKLMEQEEARVKKTPVVPADLKAVAGDDEFATQLDLARAYIEMNQMELARTLLLEVKARGSEEQKKEAQQLIARL